MDLLLLILIAGAVGYFIARSRLSQPIDDAASKVAATSKGWAEKVESWWNKVFKRQKVEPAEVSSSVVEVEVKPAEKTVSRRRSEAEPESSQEA